MADGKENIMRREMIIDLCYRLRLTDDLFCHAADAVVSAIASDDFSLKTEAVREIREYSQALQIVHSDFLRIMESRHVVFPPDIADWIWDEPNADTRISLYLERMHTAAHGMELQLDSDLLRTEVRS